jgi:hypothetical protein
MYRVTLRLGMGKLLWDWWFWWCRGRWTCREFIVGTTFIAWKEWREIDPIWEVTWLGAWSQLWSCMNSQQCKTVKWLSQLKTPVVNNRRVVCYNIFGTGNLMLLKSVFITVYKKVECFLISPSFILKVLNKLPYRVIQEERSIFLEVIVGWHCKKKYVHMSKCLFLNGCHNGAVWICKRKTTVNGNKERENT